MTNSQLILSILQQILFATMLAQVFCMKAQTNLCRMDYKQHSSNLMLNGEPAGSYNNNFQSSFTAISAIILKLSAAALY